jgi:hypothetical protein
MIMRTAYTLRPSCASIFIDTRFYRTSCRLGDSDCQHQAINPALQARTFLAKVASTKSCASPPEPPGEPPGSAACMAFKPWRSLSFACHHDDHQGISPVRSAIHLLSMKHRSIAVEPGGPWPLCQVVDTAGLLQIPR